MGNLEEMSMKEIKLFACKNDDGSYSAEHIMKDGTQDDLSGLEYGDVAENEYQIWEYPSGKMYDIKSDRPVASDNYYAGPYSTRGIVWLPILVYVKTDPEYVNKEYFRLSSYVSKPSLLHRLISILKK